MLLSAQQLTQAANTARVVTATRFRAGPNPARAPFLRKVPGFAIPMHAPTMHRGMCLSVPAWGEISINTSDFWACFNLPNSNAEQTTDQASWNHKNIPERLWTAGQEANSFVGPLWCRRTVKTHYEFASSEYSLGITSQVQHCPAPDSVHWGQQWGETRLV